MNNGIGTTPLWKREIADLDDTDFKFVNEEGVELYVSEMSIMYEFEDKPHEKGDNIKNIKVLTLTKRR